MFYASVLGYRYICSKFITAPMIHDRNSDMRKREEFCVILTMIALLIVHDYV